jgi:hypothetical protein
MVFQQEIFLQIFYNIVIVKDKIVFHIFVVVYNEQKNISNVENKILIVLNEKNDISLKEIVMKIILISFVSCGLIENEYSFAIDEKISSFLVFVE